MFQYRSSESCLKLGMICLVIYNNGRTNSGRLQLMWINDDAEDEDEVGDE